MAVTANDSLPRLAAALAGRYTLLAPLGAGGMATVYRARDERHGRDVALKTLRPELGDTLGRERFLREIRLAASLTHPHILPLYDSGDDAGTLGRDGGRAKRSVRAGVRPLRDAHRRHGLQRAHRAGDHRTTFRARAAPVSSVRPDVPTALAQLVEQLLAKAADDRIASGADVVRTLRTPVAVPVAATIATAPAAEAPAHTDRSVVVLPFENISPDPDTGYFSDGLTDELITDLSRVRALRVISRTTAMQYKGTTQGLRAIGDALGVRWALTGSVRRAGSALRISAQLVDVRTDEPQWAEKYTGTLEDVFDVQERVSRAIVSALDVALSPQESAQLSARPLQDVRAFELYLKAREALAGYDVARAEPLIGRAIELAGRVPVLRALEAMRGIMRLRTGATRDPALIASIEQEARALIAEAPGFAQGHALLGYLAYETGDPITAVRSLRRAVALDPSDGDIRFFLGISLQVAGKADPRAALEWLALDPLSVLANGLAGVNSWWTGRFADGTSYLEEAVRLDPAGLIFRWALGNHYALLDRFDDAARQARWLAEHAPHFPYTATLQGLVLGAEGRKAEALAILEKIDESALDGHHLFHLAESYAMAGGDAKAVTLLDRAVTMGFYATDYYERMSPFFGAIRGREDFARTVARSRVREAEFVAAIET